MRPDPAGAALQPEMKNGPQGAIFRRRDQPTDQQRVLVRLTLVPSGSVSLIVTSRHPREEP